MNFLSVFQSNEGVYFLNEPNSDFEENYLKIREKEDRVLSDDMVLNLPQTSSDYRHHQEWSLRQVSTKMVIEQLRESHHKLALDLGCGNGWFTSKLTDVAESVIGLDMNMHELKQAKRVFGNEGLSFCYADVFTTDLPKSEFDLITVNAAIQYFPNAEKLISRLLELLTQKGEIHIIDSPFYNADQVTSAVKRTETYFANMGSSEMTKSYLHHTWESLYSFNQKVLFNPNHLKHKLTRKLGFAVSPFPWIVIRK
ncbi:MAG: ubiquinone/menaquinone biosynthesis C-methylase UbiE [Bacteroidia bacterium]|jgi:ubiquinone/menaquinone biosynthesis C-methylase UbiE